MAIPGPESGLLFITLTNPHLMIGIDEIQLDESFCPAKPIERFSNQG